MASKKSKKSHNAPSYRRHSDRRAAKKKRFNMDVTTAELRAIRAAADAKGMSASAWVRTTLQEAIDAT